MADAMNITDLNNEIAKIDAVIKQLKNSFSVKQEELSLINSAVSDNRTDISTLDSFLKERAQRASEKRGDCSRLYNDIQTEIVILTPQQITAWISDMNNNVEKVKWTNPSGVVYEMWRPDIDLHILPLIIEDVPLGLDMNIDASFLSRYDSYVWSLSDWIYYKLLSKNIFIYSTLREYHSYISNPMSAFHNYYKAKGLPITDDQKNRARITSAYYAKFGELEVRAVELMNSIKAVFNEDYPVLTNNFNTLIKVHSYFEQNIALAESVENDITALKNKIVEATVIKQKYLDAITKLQQSILTPAVPIDELPVTPDIADKPPIVIDPLPDLPDIEDPGDILTRPEYLDMTRPVKPGAIMPDDSGGDTVFDETEPGDTDIPGKVIKSDIVLPAGEATGLVVPAVVSIALLFFMK